MYVALLSCILISASVEPCLFGLGQNNVFTFGSFPFSFFFPPQSLLPPPTTPTNLFPVSHYCLFLQQQQNAVPAISVLDLVCSSC